MHVLFTNAGRRTYLIEFSLALRAEGFPLEVFVSDCTRVAPAFHVSPLVKSLLLPPVLDDRNDYAKALKKAITDHGIDVVFPLSDLDQEVLAEMKDELAERKVTAVVASPEVVAMCNNKREAFLCCRAKGIPTPDSWFSLREFPGKFPVIRKHVFGSGSSGLAVVRNVDDLKDFHEGRDMLQELVCGTEYGVDILNDLGGNFVHACAKRKLLMRAGETDRAVVVRHPVIEALAQRVGESFRHVGNLDIDLMETADGQLFCFDFNARFGGGYPATHLAGLNYLRALLEMARGERPDLPAEPRLVTVMKGLSLFWFEGEP